jgi:DNA-binding LacI/PurR family transcriptional regulator
MVDGVIVTATQMGDPLVDHLQRVDMPFVIVGRPDDGRSMFSVDADNRGGARMAVHHLAGLGRTRIGLISPPSNTTAGLDRHNGFLDGLAETGLDIDGLIAEGNWTEESGRAAMEMLLKAPTARPDAVFVGSDRMAVGALRAIRDAGLSCPGDIALVSFDGILPPDQTAPRLTSVAQPVTEVGERAARLLQSVVDGTVTTPEHVVFPTRLVIRESCGSGETNGA